MARENLTDAKVARLRPGSRRFDVQDALVPGLIVHVTPSGHKTWMLKRRYPGSRYPTRRAIGEVGAVGVAQARAEARQWLDWLGRGIDPAHEIAEQKRRVVDDQALTFSVVAELYIKQRLAGQRQGERSAREIRKELIPAWGARKITAITRGDVIRLIDAIRGRAEARPRDRAATGAYAHIIYSHCRALFNFAVLRYDLPASPCDRLKPKDIIGAKRPRERVLNDAEIRALWKAANAMGYPYGPLLHLLLLSGCRKGEVSDARWREFNLEAKAWTIPAARFKSDSEHVVPLTPDMVALLTALPQFCSGDLLFSTTFGNKPVNGFSKCTTRLQRLMREELGGELQPFTIHDLRRTVRTRLSELRVPEHIAEAVIGHAKRGLARVYNQHRYRGEIREALEQWNARLRAIAHPPAANVVVMRSAAAEA
jgi:integrase